ncbi:hypothetical protein [Amycolatopsis sp. PS_44_ISF1]|nr:hypothetical protein [Amycolatopsis sp. PS_44_ISF1]MDT8914131.1 hypothetical protein [Amycolatopsis sp. PS_44_ISF1]
MKVRLRVGVLSTVVPLAFGRLTRRRVGRAGFTVLFALAPGILARSREV